MVDLKPEDFSIASIDVTQGYITNLEKRLIEDTKDEYFKELKDFVVKKTSEITNSNYEHKNEALAALKSFDRSITAYKIFLEERK